YCEHKEITEVAAAPHRLCSSCSHNLKSQMPLIFRYESLARRRWVFGGRANVPEFYASVPARRYQTLSIRTEGQRPDLVVVCSEALDWIAGRGVPEDDRSICAGRGDQSAIRAIQGRGSGSVMSQAGATQPSCFDFPKLDCAVGMRRNDH